MNISFGLPRVNRGAPRGIVLRHPEQGTASGLGRGAYMLGRWWRRDRQKANRIMSFQQFLTTFPPIFLRGRTDQHGRQLATPGDHAAGCLIVLRSTSTGPRAPHLNGLSLLASVIKSTLRERLHRAAICRCWTHYSSPSSCGAQGRRRANRFRVDTRARDARAGLVQSPLASAELQVLAFSSPLLGGHGCFVQLAVARAKDFFSLFHLGQCATWSSCDLSSGRSLVSEPFKRFSSCLREFFRDAEGAPGMLRHENQQARKDKRVECWSFQLPIA